MIIFWSSHVSLIRLEIEVKFSDNFGQNTRSFGLFILAQFPFTTSAIDLDYYQQKVNIEN